MEQASLLEGYEEYGKHGEPEKKQGFFAPKQESSAFGGADFTEIRNLSRRLRVLEERYANQRKTVQVLEHSILTENKKLQAQVQGFQRDMDDLKKQMYEMKQKFDLIGAELADTAKREDVMVLEKYINLWEPLNFVSRNEVERMITAILENKQKPAARKQKQG